MVTHSHRVCLALRACLLHKFLGCLVGGAASSAKRELKVPFCNLVRICSPINALHSPLLLATLSLRFHQWLSKWIGNCIQYFRPLQSYYTSPLLDSRRFSFCCSEKLSQCQFSPFFWCRKFSFVAYKLLSISLIVFLMFFFSFFGYFPQVSFFLVAH